MSISATTGATQVYTPITYPQASLAGQDSTPADDGSVKASIEKQQDATQQQQTAQAQAVQPHTNNPLSVNLFA